MSLKARINEDVIRYITIRVDEKHGTTLRIARSSVATILPRGPLIEFSTRPWSPVRAMYTLTRLLRA